MEKSLITNLTSHNSHYQLIKNDGAIITGVSQQSSSLGLKHAIIVQQRVVFLSGYSYLLIYTTVKA
jgi:hypothetical protein